MPKIGKALYVAGGLSFVFALTIGSDTYNFDRWTETQSVENKYNFVKEDKGWYLEVFTNAVLNFFKLQHRVDICCVGGGGGGGGGTCGGSGQSQSGRNGGAGGGGYVVEQMNKTLTLNNDYTITIGTGGNGGTAYGTSTWQAGRNGDDGTATSFGSIITASGGSGGKGGAKEGAGSDGAGGDRQHCFNDDAFPEVSGKSGRKTTTSGVPGVGGGHGGWDANYYGDPHAFSGDNGANGLFVIRSSR